jgi:hypothetical protein
MDDNNLSKIIVYDNGDMMDTAKVRELLFAYWRLAPAERRAFNRLHNRVDLENEFKKADAKGEEL